MDAFDKAVAAALRGKQAESQVALNAVVEATGIPERTLIRYMQGQRAIPLSKMVAIAGVIGADASQIVKGAIEAVKVAEQQQRV